MKVSVILTSYNHEKYIAQAIDSILAQTYKDFELIIYDDCSSDNSLEIINSYSDSRIRVVANEFNRGNGVLKYVFFNFVQGEYVAIAHSDDYWETEKLEKQVKYLEEHKEVDAVFSRVKVVDEDGKEYADNSGFYYNVFDVENRNRYEWLRYFFYQGNCLCHPSILIRKNVYVPYQMFTIGLRQIPDFYMWIRLCLHSEIYILEDRLSCFRVRKNESNTSGFRKDTSVRSASELNLILEQFLDLKEYDDFIKVFPEAKDYAKRENFICEYAFARICLQEDIPNYKKAYGISLLYKLLNDPEKAEILRTVYNFSVKDFFELTGKYDIYGLYPNALKEQMSVYLDVGEGYSEENVLHFSYEYWQESQVIEAKFEVDRIVCQNINKVRIDPLENKFIRCKVIKFQVNGIEKEIIPINSYEKNGADIFLTHDPSYEYINDEENVEQISLVIQLNMVSCEEISLGYTQQQLQIQHLLGQEINQKLEDVQELKKALERKEVDITELFSALERKNEELKEANGQIERKNEELKEANGQIERKNEELKEANKEIEKRGKMFWRLREKINSRARKER